MRKLIVFLLIISFSTTLFSQNKPAYKLFNANGKKTSYKQMIKQMNKADYIIVVPSTMTKTY